MKKLKDMYNFEEKKDKNAFIGVHCAKITNQIGQKPACRSQLAAASLGNKFLMYGGTGTSVYNDIRSLDCLNNEWKILRPNWELHDFPGRFGHSMDTFERYLVIFGGCGPYMHKLKKRNCY